MATSATETVHPQAKGLQALAGRDVLALALQTQIAAVDTVRAALPGLERVALAGAQILADGGRMAYAGAGSSGLMALADCLELAGTFGIPSDRTPMLFAGGAQALLHLAGAVEDDRTQAQADFNAAGLRAGDLILCISASGTTPYTLAVAEQAKAAGVLVAGVSNGAGTPLLTMADFAVCLETGPEIVAGSTRLGAATAQKVALNLISVLVGIRLGHVQDGYMVNLVADNAKLVDRALHIVAALSGSDIETARTALMHSDGAVKPAVLVAAGIAPEEAHDRLKAAGGQLGAALATIGT